MEKKPAFCKNRTIELYTKNSGFNEYIKTSEILNLTLKEFEDKLSPLNHEYVAQVYKSSLRAFISYQEMAEYSGRDECLGINQYFNAKRESSTEYKEYLKELFD